LEALGLSSAQMPLWSGEEGEPLLRDGALATKASRALVGAVEEMDRLLCARPSWRRQEQAALQVLAASTLALFGIAARWPRHRFEASAPFLDAAAGRPEAFLQYDQLYCSPDSTERRAETVLLSTPTEGAILLLGDDDLTSLALAKQHDGEIVVIEYDQRLLDHLHEQAPRIQGKAIDLFLGGLPATWCGYFDAVVLDPPWDDYHAWCFLHKAMLSLKDTPDARLFLSFCPLNLAWLERKEARFWKRFAAYGFVLEAIDEAWHLYPLEGTEFRSLLLSHIPPLEHPLLPLLCELPFGFSNLYTFRRARRPPSRWRRAWQHFWHGAN
jgi:hypothetical protein